MKKCKFFLLLTLLPLFISVSCGKQTGSATATVYNQSDFVVTDITIGFCVTGVPPFLSELQPGAEHTFYVSWEEQPGDGSIQYYINGELFWTQHEESALQNEDGYYYLPQLRRRLTDGVKAYIYIKNESWELIIKDGK